jgi:hypothetical protein
MRLAAVVLGVMVWCGTATSQTTPVRMGLWDVTIRTKATVPPVMTAAMTKNGLTAGPGLPVQTIDPPVIQRMHSCMDEATWKRNRAAVTNGTAPKSCVFTHQSEDAHSYSAGLKCDAGGMVIVVENKLSWVTREKTHLTLHSEITYPGVAGKGTESTELSSVFLSSDCGAVAPGTSVPVK